MYQEKHKKLVGVHLRELKGNLLHKNKIKGNQIKK